MRTVIFSLGGAATPGDLVMVSYSAARGGRSTAKHVVRAASESDALAYDENKVASIAHTSMPADTMTDVVAALAKDINSATSEWCPGYGDFKAVAKGTQLIVMCSDLLSDATFHFDVEGAGTETCEIEVLG